MQRPLFLSPSVSALLVTALLLFGCAVATAPPERARRDAPPRSAATRLERRDLERLERIMVPLLRAADRPRRPSEVRVGIVDDPGINAANAGNGVFYVTTGLLTRASDNHLRGVLAHEIAHDDLGHVARAQILGTGINLGIVLLEALIPGSSAVTPIAGTLIARGYSRSEEYEADRHAVRILERAGYSGEILVDTLMWVRRVEGDSGGGFLSTHPATADRIEALKGTAFRERR